jgi:hypothetical protein
MPNKRRELPTPPRLRTGTHPSITYPSGAGPGQRTTAPQFAEGVPRAQQRDAAVLRTAVSVPRDTSGVTPLQPPHIAGSTLL